MNSSPFKFLDAYGKEDEKIFFGRKDEIELLYKMVFQTNLILVYGQSGTGKTSLIRCGLANKFKDTDWYDLYIRRRDNINDSFRRTLEINAETPIPKEDSIKDAVYSLYLDYLKPVYLIFDQFEELFILGKPEEQMKFFNDLNELTSEDIPCTVILVMREEYIAMLYPFEKIISRLFNKRIRIEPMSFYNLHQVIKGSTEAFEIEIEEPEDTILKIIDNISDGKKVQLSYLQVYLDKLYRDAVQESENQPEKED